MYLVRRFSILFLLFLAGALSLSVYAQSSRGMWLAELVTTHRLDEDEAVQTAADLAYHLAKEAYRL